MKKKGFTLIELIVVIAIIGVLAAILVPAMLGYIKKSKITSANSAAKSISTGAQSAITDMDAEDRDNFMPKNITSPVSWTEGAAATATSASATDVFKRKVENYFADFSKLNIQIDLDTNGNLQSVAVIDKSGYPGSNPRQYTVDQYDIDNADGTIAITEVATYAKS